MKPDAKRSAAVKRKKPDRAWALQDKWTGELIWVDPPHCTRRDVRDIRCTNERIVRVEIRVVGRKK